MTNQSVDIRIFKWRRTFEIGLQKIKSWLRKWNCRLYCETWWTFCSLVTLKKQQWHASHKRGDCWVFLMRMRPPSSTNFSTLLEIHAGPPVINKLNRVSLVFCGVISNWSILYCVRPSISWSIFPELYLLYHVHSQSFRDTFWMRSSTLHRDCHLTSMSYIQLLKVMQGLMWDYISLELTLVMLRFSMKKICQMKALHNFFCCQEVNWTKLTCIHF